MKIEQKIFKKGSTTYYFSSKFFPRSVRDDVFALYSFVRTADDYVDNIPQRPKQLLALEKKYVSAIANPTFDTTVLEADSLNTRVVKNVVRLSHLYKFDPSWTQSFIDSMKKDINASTYKNLDDSLKYVYGSADVIGLMMARIMGLPDEALPYAAMQGRAMQWINFIRDIAEDNELGRIYFPVSDLKDFGLKDLTETTVKQNPEAFKMFMHHQLKRYHEWQQFADKGMKYIPRRLRIPLRTAIDMYGWTAQQIEADPTIVFNKKVKPRKRRILRTAAKNSNPLR